VRPVWLGDVSAESGVIALLIFLLMVTYLVSFWVLDGTDAETAKRQGWNQKYNFGSLEAAAIRWKAVLKAGADFLSTDQYEEVAKVLQGRD